MTTLLGSIVETYEECYPEVYEGRGGAPEVFIGRNGHSDSTADTVLDNASKVRQLVDAARLLDGVVKDLRSAKGLLLGIMDQGSAEHTGSAWTSKDMADAESRARASRRGPYRRRRLQATG